MGYYIEVLKNFNKAEQIVDLYNAKITSEEEAFKIINKNSSDVAVIVVVQNRLFDAAGFAFNRSEFEAFTLPDDSRTKTFLLMNRDKCKELTNFPGS